MKTQVKLNSEDWNSESTLIKGTGIVGYFYFDLVDRDDDELCLKVTYRTRSETDTFICIDGLENESLELIDSNISNYDIEDIWNQIVIELYPEPEDLTDYNDQRTYGFKNSDWLYGF